MTAPSLLLRSVALVALSTACGESSSDSNSGNGGAAGSAGASSGGTAGGGAVNGGSAGNAGRGGSAGGAERGGSAGGAERGGSAGGAGRGGSAGSAGRGGNAGASGASGNAGTSGNGGELCADRTGGALVDFTIVEETLRVWIESPAFVTEAERLLASGESRIPVFEDLLDGSDCDSQWSWHPNPVDVDFADFTIEICDGIPSYIEENKTEWLGSVDAYCPWSATVSAVTRR